ncbi:MAG: GAF domain-containing protein [Clostridiales bacterium]|jgi:L-methionine (R)-S-oxide reductase|nr:GAF domain-containing protein [Clostridiales bacterium]
MYTVQPQDKKEFYLKLTEQLRSLVEGESFYLPNLANAAALLFNALPDINWSGFYLMHGGELVLGPFQGKVACIRIQVGKGVCGTAVAERRTQLVPDVHKFPGHIACDSASNSEIVIPILSQGVVVGVLDIDSPVYDRFDEEDKEGLESFVRVLESACEWDDFRTCLDNPQ